MLSISVKKSTFNSRRGWPKIKKCTRFSSLETGQKYPQKFPKIIDAKSYSLDHIVNANEPGPYKQNITNQLAGCNRKIFLFSNISGDHVMKSLVIGKANPQSFESFC